MLALSLSVGSCFFPYFADDNFAPLSINLFFFLERSLNPQRSAMVFLTYSVEKWELLSTCYSTHCGAEH